MREAYCAKHSNIPADVESALEYVEQETNNKLSKQYMLTGRLAAATLGMLVRMSGASNVLEIGAYTGYSAIALARCRHVFVYVWAHACGCALGRMSRD